MTGGTAIWDRRLILVTGKGGVGKTTITAALARSARNTGRRVLLAEVVHDPLNRSPLLEYFGHGHQKADEPFLIQQGLHAVCISPATGHRMFLQSALKIRLLVDTAMKSSALRRFLMAAPTFPEIGILYQLVHLLRSRDFDHLIVDLPATGHALGLLAMPRTVLPIVHSGLIGDALTEGLKVLTNPAQTGAVVVTLPEAMPVTESLEMMDKLRALQVPVRAVILNRMPHNPFSEAELVALRAHLATRNTDSLLLGTREFRRLERALAADQQFRRERTHGVVGVEVPEVVDLRHLVDQVQAALEQNRVGLD